jgi:hypothetical protein
MREELMQRWLPSQPVNPTGVVSAHRYPFIYTCYCSNRQHYLADPSSYYLLINTLISLSCK